MKKTTFIQHLEMGVVFFKHKIKEEMLGFLAHPSKRYIKEYLSKLYLFNQNYLFLCLFPYPILFTISILAIHEVSCMTWNYIFLILFLRFLLQSFLFLNSLQIRLPLFQQILFTSHRICTPLQYLMQRLTYTTNGHLFIELPLNDGP